ncbi:MAG: CRISPR-associated endonuclease Cas1 [Bacteroidales bacterium]|jgi:CRISPR-associated protein Cas1|nr:CRISPR-associated endonuclease Cas1 [Bacteroidales bacterium]
MKVQLYIDTAQTKLSVKDRLFFIQSPHRNQQISPLRIDSIAITSDVQINSAAIKLAALNNIPIFFYQREGKLIAQLRSPVFLKHADLRYKQLIFMKSVYGNKWITQQIIQKIKLQSLTIKRWAKILPSTASILEENILKLEDYISVIKLLDAKQINLDKTIMGLEGNTARIYYKSINLIIPEAYRFEKRSRQPGADYFNVVLNYLYGLTYGKVTKALHAAGLDTYVGALHKTAHKETLVFDFIESFRPIVDRLLIDTCNEHLWQPQHFNTIEGGYLINKEGKKLLFTSYSDFIKKRINWKQKVTTIENHMFHEARRLKIEIENTKIHVSDIL